MTLNEMENEFIKRYKKGDTIYYPVARRFFKSNMSLAINEMIVNKQIEEDKLYRCPVCMRIAETSITNDGEQLIYHCTCYECDYSDYDYNFIEETCFKKL
jgi:hypothetical protein